MAISSSRFVSLSRSPNFRILALRRFRLALLTAGRQRISLSIISPGRSLIKREHFLFNRSSAADGASIKMFSLNASLIPSSTSQLGKSEVQKRGQIKPRPLSMQPVTFGKQTQISKLKSAAFICASALNARCGAEQTQTVTRQSSTITIAPVQGKEKSPDLDDGGTGFPPRDDDGGGGGGGGGGGWSGGFFFFGFLAFLGFLKDQEKEDR
ncbi:hypothetical protein L1887_39096 [Cichorium endivia]|nr:hypothetical protein L1887_39096 [Cichorium endivia]